MHILNFVNDLSYTKKQNLVDTCIYILLGTKNF